MGKVFFDPTVGERGGFLHEGLHPAIPDTAKEIPHEAFDALLAAQGAGKEIWPGKDGFPELRDPALPTGEKALANLRETRNRLLSKTDTLVNRHRDERDLGEKTTLSDADFSALLARRQELRDLPSKSQDPWSDHMALLGQLRA
ncbi:MAG TPA: hypothetical protein VGH23_16135 [Rhizomicrobium sp.]